MAEDTEALMRKEIIEDIDEDRAGMDGNFYGHKTDGEEPGAREENFFESVGLCCCPKLSIKQFIVIITLVELVTFIVTCSIYGLSSQEFLAPDARGIAWGWSDVRKIREDWQLWRLFTPTLLHGHFEHISGNFVGQLFMGVGIEDGIGFWRMVFLYVLGGLGGILFSMDMRPNTHGVGASTAIFGLVGFYIAYIFTHFSYMGRVRVGQRVCLIVYTSVMVLLNLNMGPHADAHVDNWGHLGGLITGILAGLALTEQYDAAARAKGRAPDRFTAEQYQGRSTCCRFFHRCGQVCLFLWFLILFVYFYVGIDLDTLPEDEDGV